MKYRASGLEAEINIEKTAELYRLIPNDADSSSASVNFRKNIDMRFENLKEHLEPYAINVYAYRDLSVVSINQPLQSVTYCGYYQAVFDNEAALMAAVKSDQDKYYVHINYTDFGFEFSFECIEDHVVLFFWTELPWLLPIPIEKNRYENRTTLPVLS